MRTRLLFASLFLIGAGCAPQAGVAPLPDDTPGVNEPNCTDSGGTVDGDSCACPMGYSPDPAGFCLDGSGKPGGKMRIPPPDPDPIPPAAPPPSYRY